MSKTGDIGLTMQDDFSFDIQLVDADIDQDAALRTAVIISLFSDSRVVDEELPPESSSRRGWWGDVFNDTSGDQAGSRLWVLTREKRTLDNLARAEEYCNEALQWMIDDGVADSVDTTAAYDTASGAMLLTVLIQKPDESLVTTFRFKSKWAAEAERS